MSALTATLAQVVATNGNMQESDLPEANFDAPWMPFFTTIGGFLVATVLAILVVIIVFGAIIWAGGKLGSSGGGRDSGMKAVLISLAAAVIIGTASTAVVWGSDIGPQWMNFDDTSIGTSDGGGEGDGDGGDGDTSAAAITE